MNENLSLDDIRHLRARLRKGEKTISEANDAVIKSWRTQGGSSVDLMLQDRSYALDQLRDTNPSIRHVALDVLAFHWKCHKDPDFAQRCEGMATNDPDDTVRGIALSLLGECYENTDDPTIGMRLAQVVCDERQASNCRIGAYFALFRLRGRFADWPNRWSIPVTVFRFPEHVDWSFVNSFLDETRIPEPVDPLASVLWFESEERRKAFSFYQKAVEALEQKEYDTAVRLFTKSIRLGPEGAGAYFMRARAYLGLGKVDDAIADFTKSIEFSPHEATAYQERGQAYALKGLNELAEQDYRKASELRQISFS